MEYNTSRAKLLLPEYGRNVQQMITNAVEIENREERNYAAQQIIKVMGQLNPHLRDTAEYTHKLWAHLIIMSDFKLDVYSPYETPTRESLSIKPERLAYPKLRIKYKHYGNSIYNLIQKATAMDESPEKEEFVHVLANLMKRFYLTWNRDSVNDLVIIEHLRELSNGKLQIKVEDLDLKPTQDILDAVGANKPQNNNQRRKRNKKKTNNRRKKVQQ